MRRIKKWLFKWLFLKEIWNEAHRCVEIREENFDKALKCEDAMMKRRHEDDGIYAAGYTQALFNIILRYS